MKNKNQHEHQKIAVHPLFVGLTRPPMYAGVPLNYFALNGFLNLVLFIATTSFKLIVMSFATIHLLGYFCCLIDVRFFDLLFGKLQCSLCKNVWFWGCNSYEAY